MSAEGLNGSQCKLAIISYIQPNMDIIVRWWFRFNLSGNVCSDICRYRI